MAYIFRILEKEEISYVVPLVEKLNEFKISKTILEVRFLEMMQSQNYECVAIFYEGTIVGVSGLWYCTRHYSGKSAEVDHVYIEEDHRGKGLGKQFFQWIDKYVSKKGYEAVELNTYVGNHASHKFYYNEGFKILGFHFLKKFD